MVSQTGSLDFKAARQAYIKASSAQDAIDNLEIGGRNLVLGTSSEWYAFNVSDGVNKCLPVFGYPNQTGGYLEVPSILGIKAGDRIQVSFDIKFGENWAATGTGTSHSYMQGSANNPNSWGGLSYTANGGGGNLETELVEAMSSSNKTAHLSTWFVVVGQHLDGTYTGRTHTNIRFDYYSGTAYIKNVMVEKASKPSAWSPAPEDLEASIESVNERSVEYIVGTQTAATGSWTGVTTDSELKTGKTIAYKLPYAGSGNASLTLTLAGGTTTAAIPVYLSNTRVTTQFPANSVIQMTYDGSNWRATAIPDNNTYDRTRVNNAFTAVSAITANHLICGTDSGYQHIAAGVSFDIGHPILYAVSAIAANATGTNNYLAYPSVNASTSGTIESGAAKKTLYLKGTVSASTFTVASSPFMTTVIPTTEDGYFYIPLGVMYSTTQIYFESSNRLYAYVNGSFQAVDVAGQILAIQSINRLNSLEPIVEQHSANFDVLEDSIMSNVEANYTRADEFNTYVDNQQSSLTQLSNSITAQFNESRELISSVNGALETYKDDISKYIRFSAEGIEIGEEGNALTLKIDNDEIGFYKEGDQIAYWDGSTLYTGNAWITLERQFRIGNFAAIPRSDGSVSWLKVGE